jgi:type VI secretion system secreted protein Hcp
MVGVFLAGVAASAATGSAGPAPTSVQEEGVPSLDFRLVWEGGLATSATTIDVLAWSWGVAATPAPQTGTGLRAGSVQMAELTFQKSYDEYSTFLARHCVLGTHASKVTLQGFGLDFETEKETVYLQVTMTDVLVTSYQTSGSDHGLPFESVSLNFAKVEYKYTPNAKGPDAKPPMTWDIVKGTKA